MDVTKLKHIHFTGIKGVGMTALALCAQDLGIKVTGTDVPEVFVTDETLKRRNIEWNIGFSASNLNPLPDLVITTGAHGGLQNPEVVFAKENNVSVLTQGEALAEISLGKELIAVCGVGGKTTTAAILATIMDVAGMHPSFAIGVGDIPSLGAPGRYDKEGKMFIAEADEYANSPGIDNKAKFLLLDPKIIIVTNIEHDHPDIYPTIDETKRVFREFFEKVPKDGVLVANGDNENTMNVIKGLGVTTITYGFSRSVDVMIDEDLHLRIPGKFNLANATAAIIVARHYGVPENKIQEGLDKFTGTKGRFEKLGEFRGAVIYDDYAHTPNEIKNTLSAAREIFPKKRIIAIFQPHTYSRTKALFNDFAQSFGDADEVAIMDIYASAREVDTLGMCGEVLAEEIGKFHKNVFYSGNKDATMDWIKEHAKNGDIVLTIGAGDIFRIGKMLRI